MRLGFWQRSAVCAALLAVGLSGVFWFVLHDFVEDEPSEWSRALLVLHGIAAFATLIAFGSLLPVHMRAGWLNRRNVVSGCSLFAVMVVLIVTALMLYYGSEETRLYTRWIHIGVGLACIVAAPLHVALGHRTRGR